MNTMNNEMKMPSLSELMVPIVEAIKQAGGHAHNDVISDRLRIQGYPEAGKLASGYRTKLEERVAWAKSYLKSYGAVTNPKRSYWAITSLGEQLKRGDEARVIQAAFTKIRRRHPEARIVAPSAEPKPREQATLVDRNGFISVRLILTLVDKGLMSEDAAKTAIKLLVV